MRTEDTNGVYKMSQADSFFPDIPDEITNEGQAHCKSCGTEMSDADYDDNHGYCIRCCANENNY